MKFNLFKRMKTGWEISDLTKALREEKKGNSNKLIEYTKDYPLSAINDNKDKFVIIRKFASRIYKGKVDMLHQNAADASEYFPMAHYAMTVVVYSDLGVASNNVFLPNNLEYKKVFFQGNSIIIETNQGQTITNTQEINTLWTIGPFSEEEILEKFLTLENKRIEPIKKEQLEQDTVEDSFFGTLKLTAPLNDFTVVKEVQNEIIEFSFVNTSLKKLKANFRKAEQFLPILDAIALAVTNDLLSLKNENWLEDDEHAISAGAFKKALKVSSITVYEEGGMEIAYDANNLFWGHSIIASIDENGNYEDASVVG